MAKKRTLTCREICSLAGLTGKKKMLRWRALKTLRGKRRYGNGFVKPAALFSIAEKNERDDAFKKGRMVFYEKNNGTATRKIFETNLGGCRLVMPFSAGGAIYTFRFSKKDARLYLFRETGGKEAEVTPPAFVSCTPDDMGHILLPALEKRGIALQAVSIARDHAVAAEGHAIAENIFLKRLLELFQRAGYKVTGKRQLLAIEMANVISSGIWMKRELNADYDNAGIMCDTYALEYSGKPNQKNNLNSNYRIIAYDPETGKTMSYYYPDK